MFTLRYLTDDNQLDEFVLAPDESTWTCKHAVTARRVSAVQAGLKGRRIAVIRADRVSYVMQPDGSTTRPPGIPSPVAREDCKRDEANVCFCSACRAERRG